MPRLPLAEFNREQATHVVSLGAYCAAAHNIRRYYGIETAYCFDWWVTPLTALPKLFDTPDADALYRRGDLMPVVNDAGIPVVINRHVGIEYFHEFKVIGTEDGPRVTEAFEGEVAQARERTAALLARLLALNAPGRRIAFLRTAFPRDFQEDAAALTARLAASLDRCFDRASYTVVMGTTRAVAWTLPPGFTSLRLVATQAADWRGHPPDWDAFLASTGIAIAPPG
ncbi:hypothetical protein J5Y09_12210 [Roseomonas sp. PWR1]|uniref:Papain-like cysteine peptidase n=1 Tax=Roseomonas nitratireducens TaxID=2820810 RepID=A0ABS4ATI6_9PROT|nr:hypothetical protein [Neoroseomonas nitratireducens]MBP0464674.1 hypothetical protein [Neoroseomonas nitratireducens]